MRADVSTSKELLLAAGVRVLREQGALHLTLRRVAAAAGTSTMGIYSGFGGRTGLLEAIYLYGFRQLSAALAGTETLEPVDRIIAVAHGYREFALADPALYALMFERPLPDFDPSVELRRTALEMTFPLLSDAVAAAAAAGSLRAEVPERTAYLLWTTMHGIVSIELTHALRSPLPGWFLDSREEGRRVLTEGVRALLAGLGWAGG